MALDPSTMLGLESGATAAVLSCNLDLSLSCRNVPKWDVSSPSDPFIVVSLKPDGGCYERVDTTEIVWDNENPNFTKEITVDYRFEEVQSVRLDVYDSDSTTIGSDLSKHDFIGSCEFVLGDCVTAAGQKLAIQLKSKKGCPLTSKGKPVVAVIRTQELVETRDEFHVVFGVKGMSKRGLGKPNPFLEIYRQTEAGDWAAIHRTNHVSNASQCTFKAAKMEVRRLCNGNLEKPVLIRCFHWLKKATPHLMGECEVSLVQMTGESSFEFTKAKKKKRESRGTLLIVSQKLLHKFSFYEFVTGGLDLNLIVAIDFTASNGNPRDSKSLHYMGPPKCESPYLRVIKSVARVLESYDSDGMIPVFGFGANLGTTKKQRISHCFPLTFLDATPEVHGFEGVIETYKLALSRVQLYGPTYFHEIVKRARLMASEKQSASHLHWDILLIITDGVVNDMQQTIDEIVNASFTSALSIIIVGVGKGDARTGFENMVELDADEVPLVAKGGVFRGKQMNADIVQFVEFDEFKDKHIGALAKEVLFEVPGQCEDYMARNGHRPGRPRLTRSATMANLYEGPHGLAADVATLPMAAAFDGDLGATPYISKDPYSRPVVAATKSYPSLDPYSSRSSPVPYAAAASRPMRSEETYASVPRPITSSADHYSTTVSRPMAAATTAPFGVASAKPRYYSEPDAYSSRAMVDLYKSRSMRTLPSISASTTAATDPYYSSAMTDLQKSHSMRSFKLTTEPYMARAMDSSPYDSDPGYLSPGSTEPYYAPKPHYYGHVVSKSYTASYTPPAAEASADTYYGMRSMDSYAPVSYTPPASYKSPPSYKALRPMVSVTATATYSPPAVTYAEPVAASYVPLKPAHASEPREQRYGATAVATAVSPATFVPPRLMTTASAPSLFDADGAPAENQSMSGGPTYSSHSSYYYH